MSKKSWRPVCVVLAVVGLVLMVGIQGCPSGGGSGAERERADAEDRAAVATADVEEIDLYDAQNRGLVAATVTGAGLSSVRVSLQRAGEDPLRVTIPAGTYFLCGGSAQNMVSRSSATAELAEEATAEVSVAACCANLHRDVPSAQDGFSVQPSSPNSELRRLMEVLDQENASEVVAQVAVWAVTDNPSRRQLDRIYRRTTSFSLSGGSPAADDADVERAGEMLTQAGIDPKSKALFGGPAGRPPSEPPAGSLAGGAPTAPPQRTESEAEMMLRAYGHRARGEYPEARRVLVDLLNRNPNHAEARYVFAWVCVETGDKETAVEQFKAVLKLVPAQSDMYRDARAALDRLSK